MNKNIFKKEVIYNNEKCYATEYYGYYVSKSGKVISTKVKGAQGRLDFTHPKELAYKIDKDGYLIVTISLKNDITVKKNIYVRVHKLVWETFNGKLPKSENKKEDITIDHIDTVKNNNKLSNLRLLTRSQNTKEAINRYLKKKGKTNLIGM